ncbi:MAG: hypothetical protein JNK25_08070 [Phycisphaerae bacterium]|nr:hypothetical protein [Phycisphaerae bacterium]
MKRTVGLLAALTLSASASATPLRLDYTVEDIGGGMYRYRFTLTLDNNDGSWLPGQRFNWIIWGDVPHPGPTNLPDFVGDLPAPAPFDDEGFSTSGGGHNGPTLLDFGTDFDFYGWEPVDIGDTLEWSGRSAIDLADGEMTWSNLIGTGVYANWEPAHRVGGGPSCPADYNEDGGVDGGDVEAFFRDWEDSIGNADVNQDGGVDGSDVEFFFIVWETGGC